MSHEIQFRRNTKHKKIEHPCPVNRKKGNLKKSKRNRVSCFDVYVVVFAFLSSTVEVGRW